MMNVVPSLVRRGFEAHTSGGGATKIQYNLPTWGAILLASTLLVFVGIMFMVGLLSGNLVS